MYYLNVYSNYFEKIGSYIANHAIIFINIALLEMKHDNHILAFDYCLLTRIVFLIQLEMMKE